MTEEQITELPEDAIDQTLFSNQEPLLQGGKSKKVDYEFVVPVNEPPRKKMLKIAAGALVVLVIITLGLSAFSTKKSATQVAVTPSATPVVQGEKSQFQQRLDELNANLLDSDPAKLDMSVPPVDMTLTLDPIKTN